MSFATATWNYPSPTAAPAATSATTPTITSTSVCSTSVASPSASPPDSTLLQGQSFPSDISATITNTTTTTTAAAASKRKRSTTMPINTAELRHEDDWTKVKDPKEKKRIQNRVAQRTYRHRMKARLGELQARLDSHERRRLHHTSPDNSDSSGSNSAIPGAYTNTSQMPGGESSPSPMPNDKMSNGGQMQMMQSSMYEQLEHGDGTENGLFPHASGLLDSPPQSHPSPQAHGLLSPPGQPGSERAAKVPQDFVLDCLRFQTQLLNKLNNLQQEPNFNDPYGPGNGVQPMMDGMSQAEQAQCVGAFTPSNPEGMEFSFDANLDVWKTDAMSHKMRSSPSSADGLDFSTLAGTTPTASMGPTMMDSAPVMRQSIANSSTSLDERFESIMEHVQTAGFDSFDALVTAYYSDTFGETSPLANEQRLSRNRRLPKVIGDVFQATSQWTPWERRGFQEEILKTAESMLISEGAIARPSLMSKISPLIESHDSADPASTVEALLNLKRTIQNELPNSWALTMALAADSRNSWQRDRSNTALATTLLLNFSGRIPNDQLLQILGACL